MSQVRGRFDFGFPTPFYYFQVFYHVCFSGQSTYGKSWSKGCDFNSSKLQEEVHNLIITFQQWWCELDYMVSFKKGRDWIAGNSFYWQKETGDWGLNGLLDDNSIYRQIETANFGFELLTVRTSTSPSKQGFRDDGLNGPLHESIHMSQFGIKQGEIRALTRQYKKPKLVNSWSKPIIYQLNENHEKKHKGSHPFCTKSVKNENKNHKVCKLPLKWKDT